jgi:ABC-type Fe2+-enterobactin transport system substrate-binding protein
MKPYDIEVLAKKPISLLRVSPDEWSAIADTRHQGVRFSLHFSHETARAAQRGGLVLIATTGSDPALRLRRQPS